MGGYDIYCYNCGLPVYDLKEYFKKIYCNISPKFLEELRLGYFRTNDGVIHNVKDFDTGGYFEYVDTDTNTVKEAHPLIENVNYNVFDVMCHRNCLHYLHPFTEPAIKKLFDKYQVKAQYFDGDTYAKKILPFQIKDKTLLKNKCKSVPNQKVPRPSKVPKQKVPKPSKVPKTPKSPKPNQQSSKKKDKKNDPDYIFNPTTKRWVKRSGKVGKMLLKGDH